MLLINILLKRHNLKEKTLIKYLITCIIFTLTTLNAESLDNFILGEPDNGESFLITFDLDEITFDKKNGYTKIKNKIFFVKKYNNVQAVLFHFSEIV